jgi:uncharacterized protein YjiS (DUF1127 family)
MQQTLRLIALPVPPRPAGLLPTIWATLSMWRRRNRTRRQLTLLDARGLADLGLTRTQQRAEASKWFWQV